MSVAFSRKKFTCLKYSPEQRLVQELGAWVNLYTLHKISRPKLHFKLGHCCVVIPPFPRKSIRNYLPCLQNKIEVGISFLKETCKRCRRSYVFISKLFSAPDAALPCLQALPPQNRCQTSEKISVIIFIIIITNCCAQVIVITGEVRYSQYNRGCWFQHSSMLVKMV